MAGDVGPAGVRTAALPAQAGHRLGGRALLGCSGDLTKALLEQLIVQARLDEDQLRAKTRQTRRNGWRQWCLAQNQGGVRAFFRWIREGPSSLQSTGILIRDGGFFSGQRALLLASEAAWWPIWQNPTAPGWSRVVPPKVTTGWQPQAFTGEELWWLIWLIAPSKAPGHDGGR